MNRRQFPLAMILALLGTGTLSGCGFLRDDDDDDGPETTAITIVNALWDDLDLCITQTNTLGHPNPEVPGVDASPGFIEEELSISGQSSVDLVLGATDVGTYNYVGQSASAECGVPQTVSGTFSIQFGRNDQLVICGDPNLWNLAWLNQTNAPIENIIVNGEECPVIVPPQSEVTIGTFAVAERNTITYRCDGRSFLLSQLEPPCPEGEVCPPLVPSQRLFVTSIVGSEGDCETTFEWEQPDACDVQ